MEIVISIIVISSTALVAYAIFAFNSTLLKLRTIEKARDIQEVQRYIFPDKIAKQEKAEPELLDLEDIPQDAINKLIDSANGQEK